MQNETEITVTRQHIKKGISLSCTHCPIALAISKQLPGMRLRVSYKYLTLGKQKKRQKLPDKVQRFMWDFDLGNINPERFEEFTFKIKSRW